MVLPFFLLWCRFICKQPRMDTQQNSSRTQTGEYWRRTTTFRFCYRKYVSSDTYNCIYNAQAQATPLNKNKAPLTALHVPSVCTKYAFLFTAPIVSSRFFFSALWKQFSVTHYIRYRQAVQSSDISIQECISMMWRKFIKRSKKQVSPNTHLNIFLILEIAQGSYLSCTLHCSSV